MLDPDLHRSSDYKRQFVVGDFRIDPGALVVHGDGEPIRLKPKAMAVLLELARQPGITLTREELLDRVWKSTYVTHGVLGHAITALRRAFGDSLDSPNYIETIPRIGYRLLAPVRVIEDGAGAGDALAEPDDAPHALASADVSDVAAASAAATRDDHAPTVPSTGIANDPRDAPPAQPAPATVDADGDAHGHTDIDRIDERPSTAAMRTAPRRWSTTMRSLAAICATACVIALGLWGWSARTRAPAATVAASDAIEASLPRRLTFATGSENNPRLDATGDWLVYTAADHLGARPRLMLQSAFGTDARPLAGANSADRPTWSPDGRRVAYVNDDDHRCAIRIASIDGPQQQTALDCAADATVYVDWNPVDASVMAYTETGTGARGGSGVHLLVDRGGWRNAPLRYDRPDDAVDLSPRFSPDGRRIAFRRGTNPTSDIYVMSATGGAVTRVTHVRARISGFDWLADGSGLVMSSNHEGTQQLYRVALATGNVRPLGILNASSPDIAARSQRMTYQQDDWSTSLSEVAIGPSAAARALAPSSGRDTDAAMSPDGARVVFVSDRDDTPQLWSFDPRDGRTERLTRHAGMTVNAPVMSSDGQRVLYITRARGRHELWEYDLRAKTRVQLISSGTSINNAVYGGDGRSVWFARWQGTQWSLFSCARMPDVATCAARDTMIAAKRVERGRLKYQDVLVLSSPQSPGRLQIVRERGLAPAGSIAQPKGDSWETIDGAVWSLASTDTGGRDATTLTRDALDGSGSRVLATWTGLHPLKYAGFAVSPDRRRVILPVVTRDSTDLAYTVLEQRTGSSRLAPTARRVERAAP